jgi:hypothetical protein
MNFEFISYAHFFFRLGDYVIVGVHNDKLVNERLGTNLPIMNIHERVLSVLGCKVSAWFVV